MKRTVVTRWLKVVIIIYCLLGIIIYYIQDYLILLPTPVAVDYNYNFNLPNSEVNIPYDKQSNINIVQFKTADSSVRGVVLYFHGNRKNISRYQRFVPYFTKSGFEVWMIDYPGYGKSTGKFSEKVVYEWSLILYNLARKKFAPGQIVIFGKSLGTGIASQLASVRNCRYLLLESPYYSMPAVFGYYAPVYPVNLMIHHQFPTYSFIQKVTDPIVIFHGTDDGVISYRHSKRLSPFLKKGDKLITLEGGTHRDLFSFPIVPHTIDSLLNK